MGSRVLITGGTGFVGLHLARALLASGAAVTLLDDLSRGRLDPEVRAVLEGAELVVHDLREPLDDTALAGPFDEIYHLAGIVGVQRAVEMPLEVLRVNVGGTLHLLDWCDRHVPGALLLSSTSEVTDGAVATGLAAPPTPEDVPAVIADVTLPRASYATSKLAAELTVAHWGRRHGVPVRVARLHNVYGPRMGRSHVIPQMLERAFDGEDPFAVYGAHQRRAFCYVDDAVEAARRLMALPGAEPLLVHVGNDREEVGMLDLARRVLAVAGHRASLVARPPAAGSPDRRCPDIGRLAALCDFSPTVPLGEGLRRTGAWYREARSTATREAA